MFSVFSQEEVGYTRSFEGLGLGMALTKRYIEINHGAISVSSRKGEGSTFTVTFPSAYRRPAAKSALQDQEVGRDRTDGKAGHLLVVEDDEQSQNYMRAILSKEHDLEVVDNANDAWSALTGKRYDLVLMDISLAGDEDGLQLTQRIRQERKISNVPVVALTAHAFPRDKQRSIEAGCNDYMTKPFQREALKALISKYIHS
jgi:CheY-like chemotaxis protein